ncbi:MAG: hypothetical protein WAX07_02090 [Candidatus Altiarchaeia archaeon]|jgi:hypothetical protein
MKNNKIRIIYLLAVLALLLHVSAGAWAITNTKPVADANYIEAEKAYNRTEYINASDAANRALRYYLDGGYMDGVMKTNELIGKIDEGLKKFGENFYKEGLKYFNNGDYDKAIENAQKARSYYEAIKADSTEVQKCDQLISKAEINKKEGNVKRADTVYTNAVKFYESGDYKNSRQMASEALIVYNQSSYQEGILKCNALIMEIDRRIQQIRAAADVNDLKANEAYKRLNENKNFEDYKEVITYATEAKKLYAQVGYEPGYNHSVELITDANNIMYGMEEAFKLKADAKFNEGRNAYLLGRGSPDEKDKRNYFENASKAYTEAKAIYYQLLNWAKDIQNPDKENYYSDLVNQCSGRVGEVQKEIESINLGKKAEELYMDGYTLFTKGDCINASSPATDAKTLFSRVNDISGVFKADTLIYQINDCNVKIAEAEAFLKNVSKYYNIADYGNATSELEKATKIYEKIKNQNGINSCTQLKQKISDSISAKKNADLLLAQAQIDYEKRKFEDSRQGAEKAKKTYTEINYLAGIGNATALIKNNNDLERKLNEQAQINMFITAGAIVAAIVLVVIGTWVRRMQRDKKEKENQLSEKRTLEEAMRRKQNEERLAEEAKLKELDEERRRLKEMIAEEMRKIEVEKRGREL